MEPFNEKGDEIKILYNNLAKENLILKDFNPDSVILKVYKKYICRFINAYINDSNKNKLLFRKINYLCNLIKSLKDPDNNLLKYKLSNKENTRKVLFLFYLIIFHNQISLQEEKVRISLEGKKDSSFRIKIIYGKIKKLYNLLHIISLIFSKSYLDKVINLEDLEILLKILVLFTINNHSNLDIQRKSNIENIMYLKECMEIIKIIYKDKPLKEEQNVLITILKYINENICLSDYHNKNNNQNNEMCFLNYTNKFYMLNNDNKTTQLLHLMLIIHKMNNPDLNKAYFELISNIYYLHYSYNNFNWPIYSFLEPLLANIDTKSYSEISSEISLLKFQLDLTNYLNEKEKKIMKEHPSILKNGFYFGEKSNNGIYAEIGNMKDNNIIITFGFKLIVNNNIPKGKEYPLIQIKKKEENSPSLLTINIKNVSGVYYLSLCTEEKTMYDRTEITPFKYYIFSLNFRREEEEKKDDKKKKKKEEKSKETSMNEEQNKGSKCNIRFICDEIDQQIFFELHQKFNFIPDNDLFLCVGCDISYNKKENNYSYDKHFTGFIGDIHIINSKGFKVFKNEETNQINTKLKKEKEKEEIKANELDLQDIILKLKGKYGNAIVKSIEGQSNLDEYITSNIDEISKNINKSNDYFKIFINKKNVKEYKIIDNVALFISSYNFKLVDYMDNVDYLNYDSLYFEKEKDLKEIKREYQYIDNTRILQKEFVEKTVEINTRLFNCNFNIFENRSSFLKFLEEDGIFHLILILEYYYQILYKIYYDRKNKIIGNNIIEDILDNIESNIYDILSFFIKIIHFSLNIKSYKITLFYYQINVVIKQYILIRCVNDKVFGVLIDFLKDYQLVVENQYKLMIKEKEKKSSKMFNDFKNKFYESFKDKVKLSIGNRHFFFDFLLNPNLYKPREKNNLLNNINESLQLLNEIIMTNYYNEDLFNDEIYNKILKLSIVFETKEFKQDNQSTKDKYINLIFNYNLSLFSEQKNKIYNNLFKFINSDFNDSLLFYYFCFKFYNSKLIDNADDNFINEIKKILEKNYLVEDKNANLKSLSLLLILYGYYIINQNENSQKKKQFLKYLINFKRPRIIIILFKLLNLIIKDTNKINDSFYDFNDYTISFETITNKVQENYFIPFFKLIINLIEDNEDMSDEIFILKEASIESLDIIYQNLINSFYEILKIDNKYTKSFFSSQSLTCVKFFYYELIYNEKKDQLLIKNIIELFNQVAIKSNYPFIFKLLELLICTINELNSDDIKNNEMKNKIINYVIIIVKSIYDKLKSYEFNLSNKKESNKKESNKKESKYYLRGIIYLLINIYNIFRMKEILFSQNKDLIEIFYDFAKLIDTISLIYSNNCIKIDNSHGKLISEILFDTFIYFLMVNKKNNEIKELFHHIFIKRYKKKDEFCTVFYLIDLLKIIENEKSIKKYFGQFVDDKTKDRIKKINDLLKAKAKNLNYLDVRINLLPHKCIEPINKANFCIYFLLKISILLFNKKKEKDDSDFEQYLKNTFVLLLHAEAFRFKTKWKNYFKDDLYENFLLYKLIKEFYDIRITDVSDKDSLLHFLGEELFISSQSNFRYEDCFSSIFIWKENESDKILLKKEYNNLIKNDNESEINNINNINPKEKKEDNDNDNSNINEKELQKIKNNLISEGYDKNYFCILDDLKKRCFIYSPKKTLIKRIFSHIYYNLLFHDKVFLLIKNKYFITFPKANKNTKQLNYPSKVKNFSNIYEPKLFLKRDFNLYNNTKYFQISHDFLFKTMPTQKKIEESKKKKFELLIKSNFSSVNFYRHSFNLNDILEEKESFFECELVTNQFLYNGFIIFGKNYIYFDTKAEPPLDLNQCKEGNYALEQFKRFCFSIRNRDNTTEKKKRILLYYQDIKAIIKKRILLLYQAIEIFCINGKSYFFNLYKKDYCNNVFTILNNINTQLDPKDRFSLIDENITEEVKKLISSIKKRKINNYIYLSQLNLYSSRSFNDISQYPVFPWIILNTSKLKLDNLLDLEKKYLMKVEKINNDKETDNQKDNQIDNKVNNNHKENENDSDDEEINEEANMEDKNKKTSENQTYYKECGLRVFSYPLSMQTEEKRNRAIEKYNDEKDDEENEGRFIYHHGGHYSNSSYVYFFLMRNNPFTQCMIKLQNYAKENPNRLFISFSDTITVFKSLPENRELVPNLFCHFDYFCNLNCAYNGHKTSGDLVDDLYDNTDNLNIKKEYSQNMLSKYAYFVYLFRRLLNSNLVSSFLPNWIDNIFGKNQLPDNPKKWAKSCNIFSKATYEEKTKLDKKLEKYIEKYNNQKLDLKSLANKILIRIDLINNFGVTPHKILDRSVKLKTSTRVNNSSNICSETKENDYYNFIYFINNNNEKKIIILFNIKNKNESKKIKKVFLYNPIQNILLANQLDNLNKNSYPCGYIKQLEKIDISERDKKKDNNNINVNINDNIITEHKNTKSPIPIFKPCYSMSSFTLENTLYIVTCRYLGNFFKIQKNNERYIDVLCEDFVNCLICRQYSISALDDIFIYTGLRNGKLIEWQIKKIKDNDINRVSIKEKRSNYFHKGEITCLEFYDNQNIIITGGKDKMIFVRKIVDFELLTVINLTHLYANPIIGKTIHIVPTLIKVSELNNIYVMLYNYETQKSFIRGYNLNGLFFSQSVEDDFMNICFTEDCNLLVSFYNQNKISILKCYDLKKETFIIKATYFLGNKNSETTSKNDEKTNLTWIDYNYKNKEFILLFKDKIAKGCIDDKQVQQVQQSLLEF